MVSEHMHIANLFLNKHIRSSGNNCSPTFLSYDMDYIENQKFKGDTQTHRWQGDLISLCLFFQNKESRLKKWYIFFDIFAGWLMIFQMFGYLVTGSSL
jgi:hypothetical protein